MDGWGPDDVPQALRALASQGWLTGAYYACMACVGHGC